jgi:hypothetical protein
VLVTRVVVVTGLPSLVKVVDWKTGNVFSILTSLSLLKAS